LRHFSNGRQVRESPSGVPDPDLGHGHLDVPEALDAPVLNGARQ